METYILHLETATKICSAGISKNGELIALKESQGDGYIHGEFLNLYIEEVIKKANIELGDLSAVSLASGPGSYTGLRIGAATAKALCYAQQIPLIAIGTLQALVEQAKLKYNSQNLIALVDARRMEVYSQIADAQGNMLKDVSADVIDANSYNDFEPFVCFGDGTGKLKEIWSGKNCIFEDEILSSAKGQPKLAYEKFKQEDFVDVAYWEPFYLKDFIVGKKG